MPCVYVGSDSSEDEQGRAMSLVLDQLLMVQLRKALDSPEFAAKVVAIAADLEDTRLARTLCSLSRPEQGEVRECACGCGRTFAATHGNQRFFDLSCGDTPEIQPDGTQLIYMGRRPTH